MSTPGTPEERKPLAIELFAGSFGWGAGLVAEGWRVVGFDIEHCPHHGPVPTGCELVLRDVRTLHGAQFKDAELIVASPPCQEFSYRAMPWKRAKALGPPVDGLNLFWQCWRIQWEACEAAGRYIPMVVENVKGAQKWVGSAAWHFGSFYLFGDVPPLMPISTSRKGAAPIGLPGQFREGATSWFGSARADPRDMRKNEDGEFTRMGQKNNGGSWFGIGSPGQTETGRNPVNGVKVPAISFSGYGTPGYTAQGFNVTAAQRYRAVQSSYDALSAEAGLKVSVYPDPRRNGGKGTHLTSPRENEFRLADGTKNGGDWFGSGENCSEQRKHGSRSDSRKAASAAIARIPFPLASWIARVFHP